RRIFPTGPHERIPTAVTEALFVAILKNIATAEAMTDEQLFKRYLEMRKSQPFDEEGLSEGLSKKDKVSQRLNKAIQLFAQ
ncbi:MAG: hypothetical protein ACK559_37500, partial [bacterium]